MSARYHVLIADELMEMTDLQWPHGLRPVERESCEFPGTHWWLLEDRYAPAELDGKKVDPVFERRLDCGLPFAVVAARQVIA